MLKDHDDNDGGDVDDEGGGGVDGNDDISSVYRQCSNVFWKERI